MNDPWRKEVHFFDRLPTGSTKQYMSCFRAQQYEEALQGRPNVFVDATPAYLYTPAAAPRIKQAIPHAKFVIVLRVPSPPLAITYFLLPLQSLYRDVVHMSALWHMCFSDGDIAHAFHHMAEL